MAKKLSISEIHRQTGIDRATIKKRLSDVPVSEVRAREVLYDEEDALRAIKKQGDDITEARRKKLLAETGRVVLKLKQEQGELLSASEVKTEMVRLFQRLFQRLAVQMTAEISPKLVKAAPQGKAEIARLLRAEIGEIFDSLRDDYTSLIGDDSGSN